MKWIAEETARIAEIIEELKAENKRVFTSSSFQSHSIPLLHLLSQIDESIPVYFLNTGFHFPETIAYKNKVSAELGLNTIDLHSAVDKMFQKDSLVFYMQVSRVIAVI
jgi:phosphoadenosine phosphosulfate reductase